MISFYDYLFIYIVLPKENPAIGTDKIQIKTYEYT